MLEVLLDLFIPIMMAECCTRSEFDCEERGRGGQACSPQYFADCQALFGGVFPHDDSVNNREEGGKLSCSWARTQVPSWPPGGAHLHACV